MFQGNPFSGRIQNHIFSSSHKELEAIGLHSFTLESFPTIWNKNLELYKFLLNNQSLAKLTTSTGSLFSEGIGLTITTSGNGGNYTFYQPTSTTFVTVNKTYSDWEEIIKYYESKKADPSVAADPLYDEEIKKVKTSLRGGVLFQFAGSQLASSISGDIFVTLQFLDRDLSSDSDKDKRIVGLSAEVPVVGIPQTPAGTPYSLRNTLNTLDKDNVGRKSSVLEGGIKNPANSASAQVDYYFNQLTGKYESGTRRMLAILLTDIDPAPINKIELSPDDLANLKPTDFTNNLSNIFTPYQPTTGVALPLNVQSNTSSLFTPNFTKQCYRDENGNIIKNGYLPETVIVTNRFNKTFKRGMPIFLTRVGIEWIPEEQVQDPASTATKLGDWSFIKLIADSDNYFKDRRVLDVTSPNFNVLRNITPSDYETAARYRFYNNVMPKLIENDAEYLNKFFPSNNDDDSLDGLNKPSGLSEYLTTFQPSERYYISTIFDQLDERLGGFQNENASFISRTNINKGDTLSPEQKYATELGVYWGPVYIDGYRKLLKQIVQTAPTLSGLYYKSDKAQDPNPSFLTKTAGLTSPNANEDDIAIYSPVNNDFPAECVSKILDPLPIINNFNNLGINYTSSLVNNHLKPPYYASVKSSNSKIQFIPLTANMVGSIDLLSDNVFNSYERNFYTRMKEFFTNYFTVGDNSVDQDTMFGNMMSRASLVGSASDSVGSWPYTYTNYNGKTFNCTSTRFQSGKTLEAVNAVLGSDNKVLTYDCFIRKGPLDKPIGFPKGLFDDFGSTVGANCFGIICGKNTISKRGGGNIVFNVVSNFGFPPYSAVSAGSLQLSSISIGGIPLFSAGDIRQLPTEPQFGSQTDEIYSPGTTTLNVRIFDAWPENLTVFDPRYFSVLHFNPGKFGSSPTSNTINDNGTNIAVDNIEYEVDFKIPTWGTGDNSPGDNIIIPLNTIIDSGVAPSIRPQSRWRVNPIRRGMLLTGGGFTYKHRKIGVKDDTKKIKVDKDYINPTTGNKEDKTLSGKKYTAGELIPLRNGLEIKIDTVDGDGAITKFSIAIDINNQPLIGDFLHTDFPFEFALPIPKDNNGNIISGAEPATLIFEKGIVYDSIEVQNAPVEHVTNTRISSSSKAGKSEVIDEPITSTFTLESNKTGQYDIFTHFHNDITHTILYSDIFGQSVKLQYINMEIV